MAKRPLPDYHFECAYNNIGKEELILFINHLPSMCDQDLLFNVFIQGGIDEDADIINFDFDAKWYGISHDKLKNMINGLPFDVYKISIVACKDCSNKKQKFDMDFIQMSAANSKKDRGDNPDIYNAFGPLAKHDLMKCLEEKNEYVKDNFDDDDDDDDSV